MSSHMPIYDLARLRATYKELPKERGALLALCRAAAVAERWDDLLRFSKEIIRVSIASTPGADLTAEERQHFFASSKQTLSALRAAWRNAKVEDAAKDVTEEYKLHLERELLTVATELATLLETTLLKTVMQQEPQIYYRKLIGDFYRYLAEVSVPGAAVLPYTATTAAPAAGTSASTVIPLGYEKKAFDAYSVAMRLATTHLEATHPTRLGLCLNYSVLLYEVQKDKKAACDVARSAFDQAISKLDDLDESCYKDTTLLMQLLRDNITLWTAQDQPPANAQQSPQPPQAMPEAK